MRSISIALLVLLAVPVSLEAQARRRALSGNPVVPLEYRPPAGKCRIWIEGVAPAQQPAPTDCQTAVREKPSNGTVIFGPQTKEPQSSRFERRDTAATGTPGSRPSPRDSVLMPTQSPPPAPVPARRPPTSPPRPAPRRPDTPAPESKAPEKRTPDRPAPARPDPDRPALERP